MNEVNVYDVYRRALHLIWEERRIDAHRLLVTEGGMSVKAAFRLMNFMVEATADFIQKYPANRAP